MNNQLIRTLVMAVLVLGALISGTSAICLVLINAFGVQTWVDRPLITAGTFAVICGVFVWILAKVLYRNFNESQV